MKWRQEPRARKPGARTGPIPVTTVSGTVFVCLGVCMTAPHDALRHVH